MAHLTRREWAGLTVVSSMIAADKRAPADPGTYLQEVVSELRKSWPRNRTLNIVCHGHSVPAGYFRTPEVRTFDAYPHLLHRAVKEHYPNAVVNVIVTAIGGENSVQGSARFARDVLTHSPDVVLIDYALNDRKIGLEAAAQAWREMIRAALSREVRVILLTPTADQSTNLTDRSAPLCQHAAQISGLATEFGVGLADSLERFTEYVRKGGDIGDLLSQSNHPNRQGHQLVLACLVPFFGI